MRDIVPSAPHPGSRPVLTVLLATFGRPATLQRMLGSIAAQSVDLATIEVVVVVNGPPGGTQSLLEEFASAHPQLCLRVATSHKPGVAHARNVGVQLARGTWLTMVDDDDWISPRYLELLLENAEPGTVPLARIADVAEDGVASFDNGYSDAFAEFHGQVVEAVDLPRAVSLNVCKLIPSDSARAIGFDERLRSASDTMFWLRLFSRFRYRFRVIDSDEAVYYRTTDLGTLSRQGTSLDFSVERRLDGLAVLEEFGEDSPEVNRLVDRTRTSFSAHINSYLLEHPDDRDRVMAMIGTRMPIRPDWGRINFRTATLLVLTDGLAGPDSHAPDVLARTMETGRIADVIYRGSKRSRPGVRTAHPDLLPRIGALHPVSGEGPRWSRVNTRARDAHTRMVEWAGTRSYAAVHSISSDPATHLAAAAFKAQHPSITWVAEVTGRDAADPVDGSPDDFLIALAPNLEHPSPGQLLEAVLARQADEVRRPGPGVRPSSGAMP